MRIAIVLLLAATAAFADDDAVISTRVAKHMITPFVGYQALNSEKIGLTYSLNINDPSFPDTTFHFEGKFDGQRNVNPPVLGLAYRYIATENMLIEGTVSILEDKSDYVYPVTMDFYGFLQRRDIPIHHTNMTALNVDGMYTFDSPLMALNSIFNFEEPPRWLGLGLRAGIGYSWRDISTSFEWDNTAGVANHIVVKDADEFLTLRGGCDLFFWKTDNLLLNCGINYTQFIPMSGDADSFGGFGWRASVFPIWSAASGE